MIGGKKIVGENEYIVYGELDNIKLMQYKDNVIVGLDAAIEIVSLRLTLFPGYHPYILYINRITCITNEAMAYLANPGYQNITKVAYLIKPFFTKVMFNAFVLLHKPPAPSKVFSEEKDAILWCKQ